MYLAIDIGGTKTLAATLTEEGVIKEKIKFPTAYSYKEFLIDLSKIVADLSTKEFTACGVGVPGRIDRSNGAGVAMGNLPWKHVTIESDISRIAHCPAYVENDANLAGLSEAMAIKHKYDRVLYITISTGIGTGYIVDQTIDRSLANSEGGQMPMEHHGKIKAWEDIASGKAIVKKYGKKAQDITDKATWTLISHDIALGLVDLITIIQPDAVVFGGSVGVYFDRFKEILEKDLQRFETPLVPMPKLLKALRPEDAVLYGCYDLAKANNAGIII
jgi:predicted NBD/HSP70 family sugar kinase